jgi:Zn-dependent peptidase ImmA (M78 family)
MAVRRKYIRSLAEQVLDKHEINQAPVPVDKIVKAMKIKVKLKAADDDLSGFLIRGASKSGVAIGVNKSHSPNRKRFTIAHELGHFLLHEGERVHVDDDKSSGYPVWRRDKNSSVGTDDHEKEANLFAAELLMPVRLLVKDLPKNVNSFDEQALDQVAEKYGVSTQALTFRLANLGYISL